MPGCAPGPGWASELVSELVLERWAGWARVRRTVQSPVANPGSFGTSPAPCGRTRPFARTSFVSSPAARRLLATLCRDCRQRGDPHQLVTNKSARISGAPNKRMHQLIAAHRTQCVYSDGQLGPLLVGVGPCRKPVVGQ